MNVSDPAHVVPAASAEALPQLRLWLGHISARLHGLGDAMVARYRRARDMESLYQFSDRELHDLGLCKSDLPSIARGDYHRD